MKYFISVLILFCSFAAHAGCNETWKDNAAVQYIYNFKVSSKAYFHSGPSADSKSKELFLISGDDFKSYLKDGDFVFGHYIRKNGTVVTGWLQLDALSKNSDSVNKTSEINDGDFVVISPYGNIRLNDSYEEFYKKWGKCEIDKKDDMELWGNYISKGDLTYKYFDNNWNGFFIRSSNINYQAQESDFDAYRITTIDIKNKKYMTSRGVYFGMSVNDVINAYGEPSHKDNHEIIYSNKYYTLSFEIGSGVVTGITMDEAIK